jgi:hypothetical protein
MFLFGGGGVRQKYRAEPIGTWYHVLISVQFAKNMRKLGRKGPQLLKRPNGTTTPIKDQENVDSNVQNTPMVSKDLQRDYPPTPKMSPPPVPSEDYAPSIEIEHFESPELPRADVAVPAPSVSSGAKEAEKEETKKKSKSKDATEKKTVEQKPLSKIVAYVDACIEESKIDSSSTIEGKLEQLGAKIAKKWSSSITHLIWKGDKEIHSILF